MADVSAAIDYVLSWEDSTLSGVVTRDNGGHTRFGIAEKFHPDLAKTSFYTSMPKESALAIARMIYETLYCEPLCIEQMANQDIANKVLSLGVNIGVKPAAMMLQESIMVVGDGRIGPQTLMVLETANTSKVLESLRDLAEKFYNDLVAKNPKLSIYRSGWVRRATA